MKLTHRIVLLNLILIFISCTNSKPRNNEITKIELARMGAWADPGAAISIDTSLNYKYYGSLNDYYPGKAVHVKREYYTGRVNEAFWDTLNYKFEKIKYKTLDTADNMWVSDVDYFELIVYWKNGRRRIIRASTVKNDLILSTIEWLNNSYKMVKLHEVKSPIQFETKFQNPPVIPAVKINNLKKQ